MEGRIVDTGRPGGKGSLAAGHRLQVVSEIIGVYDPSITPDRAGLFEASLMRHG